MKKWWTAGFLSGCLLFSCVHFPKADGRLTTQGLPRPHYECEKLHLSLDLYGDYWVHGFNRREMLNWNRSFAKLLDDGTGKPLQLLAAHTTVDPYCSALFLVYPKADSTTFAALEAQVKPTATGLEKSQEIIGTQRYVILDYELRNPSLRVSDHHVEFLCLNGTKLLRASFWSREPDKEWLKKEAAGILETLDWRTGS